MAVALLALTAGTLSAGWPVRTPAAEAATAETRLGYTVREVGGISLYTIRTNGTWKRQLNNEGELDTDLAYAPNGAATAFIRIQLATSGPARLYELRHAVNGRDSTVVYRSRHELSGPVFSPSADRLAVSVETVTGARIYSLGVDGTGPRWLTSPPVDRDGPRVDDRDPAYSPDGGALVFSRWFDGYPQTAQLWRTPLTTPATAVQLTSGGFTDHAPVWSAKGRRILFIREESDPAAPGAYGVWSVPAAGGTPVAVVKPSAPRLNDLAMSPDGTKFAVASWSRRLNVKGGVFTAAADGTGLRAARLEVGETLSVAWGPPAL